MENLNQILQLPDACLVNKKITKAFFKRNFDLTLTERKLLDDATIIQQIDWLASIKPLNSNIPLFNDGACTYEEVQIISVTIGNSEFEKQAPKVIELLQKYIPYHVFLILTDGANCIFNTVSKRINLNDSGKRTNEKALTSEMINTNQPTKEQRMFLENCAFANLDKHDLKSLYQSWESCIASLQASAHTGEYKARPIERAEADVNLMEEIRKLETEIMQLQSQAKKETQLNTQVQINSEVQFRRKQLETLKSNLK